MITLYSFPISPNATKAILMLEYLNIPYKNINIDLMKGEQYSESFLSKNPAGKVPVLEDEGFHLSESNAIVEYLAEKYNPDLVRNQIQERAKMNELIHFITIHIESPMLSIYFNKLIAENIGAEVDQRALQEKPEIIKKSLNIIEQKLSMHPYLLDNQISIADIIFLSHITSFESIDIDLTPYPNITKWKNALMEQDFYKRFKG